MNKSTRTKKMITTVYLEKEVHKKIRHYCIETGMNLEKIIMEWYNQNLGAKNVKIVK